MQCDSFQDQVAMATVFQRTANQARLLKSITGRLLSRRMVSSSSWHLSNASIIDNSPITNGFPKMNFMQVRFHKVRDVYEPSPNAPKPVRADYEVRIWDALKNFDRFPKDKPMNLDAHFINDLGLDSLDHVELIVCLETEFQCEIPDDDAEKLMTPRQMVDYFCAKDRIGEKRTEYGEQDFKLPAEY